MPHLREKQVTIAAKYGGYIDRQAAQVDRFRRLEEKALPDALDYAAIAQLRAEAREKFARVRPRSIGQAGRISGVSPSWLSAWPSSARRRRPP